MTVQRRSLALALALLLTLLAAPLAWTGERATRLEFPRFNDTFRDLAPDIMPVSAAGLTINLRSPTNSLTVRSHSLELEPLGGPRHRFRGRVDFLGKANLIAEFAGSMPGGIEDQVLLPTQELELEGEVDLLETPGGYDITTRRLPRQIQLAMQSRLGNQLIRLCDMMTILSGGDCSGLDAAFAQIRVPLPPVGETYFLADEQLTAEERQQLDDYLAAAARSVFAAAP